MDRPTHHTPDSFERAQRERELPHAVGAPEFEAAVILAHVKAHPGSTKSEVVKRVMGRLGRPQSDERIFLRYLDGLESLKQIVRYNFAFHITPIGQARLKQIRENLSSALNLVYTAA